jgi:hypothetical protein
MLINKGLLLTLTDLPVFNTAISPHPHTQGCAYSFSSNATISTEVPVVYFVKFTI